MAMTSEGRQTAPATVHLEGELQGLLRKRSQYRIALETASDARIITRMVADLKQLDEEIIGCEQALAALPKPEGEVSVQPPTEDDAPTTRPVLQFQAHTPDWDDEPATTLYEAPMQAQLLAALEFARPGLGRKPVPPQETPPEGMPTVSPAADGAANAAQRDDAPFAATQSQAQKVAEAPEPVSIHELERMEAQMRWNSDLSPASFAQDGAADSDVMSSRFPSSRVFQVGVAVAGLAFAIGCWVALR